MALTAAQTMARLKGLGGSDAAAILGLSPYRGPFDIWARFHLPKHPGDDQEESEASEWGNILEEPIASQYALKTGFDLAPVPATLHHPKLAHVIAHPDRLVLSPKTSKFIGGLEIKTAGVRQAVRWGDPETEPNKVPEEYEIQTRHYMAVTGLPWFDLAVLIGGQEFRIYRIERDLEIENMLLDSLTEFWETFILTGREPPLQSPKLDEWLKILYPRMKLPEIAPTDTAVALARAYDDERARENAAKEAKEAAGHQLRAMIGDSEGFRWHKSYVTWKNNKDGEDTDWEAVARDLGATNPEVLSTAIRKHTKTVPGARVLRVTVKE